MYNTDYRYMHSQNARAVYNVITQISVYNGIYLCVCKYMYTHQQIGASQKYILDIIWSYYK